MIKTLIKAAIFLPLDLYFKVLNFIRPSFVRYYREKLVEVNSQVFSDITHKGSDNKIVNLKIFTPNAMCLYRANSFSEKEPETLSWIDKFGGDDVVFFDIGANIGLYSLYYASRYKSNIFAFEPSPFNIIMLAKNININNFQKHIKIISNPLSKVNKIQSLAYPYFEEGSSSAAFGVEYGADGKQFKKVFEFETAGFTLDYLISNGIIEDSPNIIKLDVDGIEHLILSGAHKVLQSPNCKSILVEVSNKFEAQSESINEILTSSGFVLDTIEEDKILEQRSSISWNHSHNQIWVKH